MSTYLDTRLWKRDLDEGYELRPHIPTFPADLTLGPEFGYVAHGGIDLLNLGAGVNPIVGAINVDCVAKRGVDQVWDIGTFPWPLEDSSFDTVTCFHMLEHLPITQAVEFFRECYRVLRTAGGLIIEVPDMIAMARRYLDGDAGMIRRMYGGPEQPGQGHYWGWDSHSLITMSTACGFDHGVTRQGTDYHSKQIPSIRLETAKMR